MNARTYRKKPVVVEAVQLLGGFDLRNLVGWIGAKAEQQGNEIVIHTLEGDMRASVGDYVIRGVQGEFYPCKPDIFEATYEPVSAS